MLSEKGKYASATENRRFVWHEIIWPLILEINDITFSLKQYQKKRDEICQKKGTDIFGLRIVIVGRRAKTRNLCICTDCLYVRPTD